MSSVASPEQSLIEQVGGWPTILLVALAGRRRRPVRGPHPCTSGAANAIHPGRRRRARPHRLDPHRPVERGQRTARVRDLRPSDRRPGGFRAAFMPSMSGGSRWSTSSPTIARATSSPTCSPSACSACSGSIRWPGPPTPPSASTRKRRATRGCWRRPEAIDRSDYGRAIAKATSGRALLFASALDRRTTLHRRLEVHAQQSHRRPPIDRPDDGPRSDRSRAAADRHAGD